MAEVDRDFKDHADEIHSRMTENRQRALGPAILGKIDAHHGPARATT